MCPIGATFDQALKTCTCPPSSPYSNGVQCLSCDLPRYFDFGAKSCVSCAQGTVYNSVAKRCEGCPPSSPIEKDGVCLACPSGSHFDRAQKLCVSCPVGTVFNATISSCLNTTITCPAGATNQNNVCVCSDSAPFYNGQ